MTYPIVHKQARRSLLSHWPAIAAILLLSLGAAEPAHAESPVSGTGVRSWIGTIQHEWLGAIWRQSLFDAAPRVRAVGDDSKDGFRLSRPFGIRGPELRLSPSMPADTSNCLHTAAGVGNSPAEADLVEAFVIVQYRW